jgi:hypothetical protein
MKIDYKQILSTAAEKFNRSKPAARNKLLEINRFFEHKLGKVFNDELTGQVFGWSLIFFVIMGVLFLLLLASASV